MNHTDTLIIIGSSHHNTLSMIRSVGHEGIKPYVILYGHTKSCYIDQSKYISTYKHVETAVNAIEVLESICKELRIKPIAISCSDEVSMLLDQRFEEMQELCYFFNAGARGRLTYYMDKQVQTELARESGFMTPWSIECMPENVPFAEVQYPCIVKPKESIHGGKKLYICKSIDELKNSLLEFDPKYSVIVQQYIQGEYEAVVIGLTIDGKSFIPGFAKKHRDYKGATTYSSIYPATDISNSVIAASEQMLSQIRYEGLWGIECIKKDDNFYFIELNLRNDATTYSMAVAGVNLPYAYYQAKSGIDISFIVNGKVEVINSMVEFDDFNFVLKRTVSLNQWRRELKGCSCRYYRDKEDMAPYRAKRKEYITFLLRRLLHF